MKFDIKTLIVRLKMEENSLDILGPIFGNSVKNSKFWIMKCKLCSNSIKSKLGIVKCSQICQG